MTEFQTGVFEMSAAQYHADPAPVPSLSASIGRVLVQESEAHAYLLHPKLGAGKRETSDAMDDGSIAHALLLGKGGEQIVVCDFDDFRSAAARTQRDAAEAAGLIPIIARKYAEHERVAKILAGKLAQRGFVLSGAGGISERVYMWTECASDGTMVQCRAMMDRVIESEGHVLDLKKAASVVDDSITKTVEKLGYHIAEAAYRAAFVANHPEWMGREKFTRLFVEIKEPFCVTPDISSGTMRQLGRLLWQRAIDKWAHCMNTDSWPEPTPIGQTHVSEASRWALEAAGFDLGGE
jgi:hypothetical protein